MNRRANDIPIKKYIKVAIFSSLNKFLHILPRYILLKVWQVFSIKIFQKKLMYHRSLRFVFGKQSTFLGVHKSNISCMTIRTRHKKSPQRVVLQKNPLTILSVISSLWMLGQHTFLRKVPDPLPTKCKLLVSGENSFILEKKCNN